VPVLSRAAQARALAVGPGLGLSQGAGELARQLVAQSPPPVVLDADGLTAFTGWAGDGVGGAGARRAALLRTPHAAEMVRVPRLAPGAVERARLDLPRAMARAWNAVVVLKGAPTVTAAPDGRATVNSTGNPGMASGGMGDALTGTVAAYLAQGLAPYDAARL